jgi:hypothetical protein
MKKQAVPAIGALAIVFSGMIPGISLAGPRVGAPRPPSFERSRGEKADPFRKKQEKVSLERLQRSQDEQKILTTLGIGLNEMSSLVREFKPDASEYASLQNLLHAALNSKSNENRVLLKNYFQLLARASGGFHLTPSRLEHQLNSWSPVARLQFAKVLEASVQISGSGKTVLREEAFERALKKYDLERDYRKQCRK